MCGRFFVDDDTLREIEKIVKSIETKRAKRGEVHPSDMKFCVTKKMSVKGKHPFFSPVSAGLVGGVDDYLLYKLVDNRGRQFRYPHVLADNRREVVKILSVLPVCTHHSPVCLDFLHQFFPASSNLCIRAISINAPVLSKNRAVTSKIRRKQP